MSCVVVSSSATKVKNERNQVDDMLRWWVADLSSEDQAEIDRNALVHGKAQRCKVCKRPIDIVQLLARKCYHLHHDKRIRTYQ